MLKKKKLKIALTLLFILGFLFVHFYLPRIIIEIKNPITETVKGQNIENKLPIYFTPIEFNSFDGVNLKGFIHYTKHTPAKGTIILLHGIRSKKEHFIILSKLIAQQGYNAIALDSRGHNESEGQFCTFGVKEKKDIAQLITFLEKDNRITTNIGVWGQSLGGAIGLQAMGNDKRIKFGIIESTFTDFRTISHDYFKNNLGFNIPFFTNYLISRAGSIGDFNPEDAKPINFCKKITQPILIVHGAKDKRIDVKYGKENFNAIPSNKKQFLTIKEGNHLNINKIGGEEYFENVFNFIDSSINYQQNIINQ
jgi:dipeptidyl aminopeptidase/acylaminoacyl peptidase